MNIFDKNFNIGNYSNTEIVFGVVAYFMIGLGITTILFFSTLIIMSPLM